MAQSILDRILRDSGMPGLLDFLGARIAPTDLQTLLLAVFHRRAAQQTPARVLAQYQQNRFVHPADLSLRELAALERLALEATDHLFDAIELAPVCPLGTVSALGPIDQNRVLTTIRNTEVVSDCTNVLALECAVRRQEMRRDPATAGLLVQLCTSQRLLRAQDYSAGGFSAHFQIFALATAGRAEAGYRVELNALNDQLWSYLIILEAISDLGYHPRSVRVGLTDVPDAAFLARLQTDVIATGQAHFPGVQWTCEPDRVTVAGYYELVRFLIYARDATGAEHELADGGFTPWTQKLLSDRKERLLVSGIALERLCTLFQ